MTEKIRQVISPPQGYRIIHFCFEEAPERDPPLLKTSCYLDKGHEGKHDGPCPIDGDVLCDHRAEW